MVGLETRWDAPTRRCLAAFGLCLMLLFACVCSAQPRSQSPTEPEVRAAVIVKILQFTSWESRPSEEDQLKICVIGEPLSGDELLQFDPPRKIGKKIIKVDKVTKKNIDEQALDSYACDITVIGKKFNEGAYLALQEQSKKKGILTICDGCDRAIANDSMIDLVLVNQRIRFTVNLNHATSANIRLDSSMLELASEVRR